MADKEAIRKIENIAKSMTEKEIAQALSMLRMLKNDAYENEYERIRKAVRKNGK